MYFLSIARTPEIPTGKFSGGAEHIDKGLKALAFAISEIYIISLNSFSLECGFPVFKTSSSLPVSVEHNEGLDVLTFAVPEIPYSISQNTVSLSNGCWTTFLELH